MNYALRPEPNKLTSSVETNVQLSLHVLTLCAGFVILSNLTTSNIYTLFSLAFLNPYPRHSNVYVLLVYYPCKLFSIEFSEWREKKNLHVILVVNNCSLGITCTTGIQVSF